MGSSCSPRDSQEPSPTPQFKSINSSVLSFLKIQLPHPYMTTGKTIALTRWTFASKVMSLLFNMLSRLVVTFLPRSIDSNAGFQIPRPKLSSWADFWILVTVFGVEAVMNKPCLGGGHAEGNQRKHDFRCLESKKKGLC